MSAKKKKPAKCELGYTDSDPMPVGTVFRLNGRKCIVTKSVSHKGVYLGLTKRQCERLGRKVRKLMGNEVLIIRP